MTTLRRPQSLAVAALLFAPLAGAQELVTHPGWLLEPVAGKVYQNGIGSPAVAYDPAADQWTMFFETQFGGVDNDCRQGRWGIGRATSPDGLTWTIDDDLVVGPEDDTYFSCVAAHPDVIFDGSTWHLWFKAHQTNTVCQNTDTFPSWGCGAVTGVGYATSTDGVNFTVVDRPVINLFSFGFPAVVKVDGVMRMLLSYSNASNGIYELWQSISVNDGATWSAPQYVLGPGFADWVEDEIYNPALVCDPLSVAQYTLFAGGRDTTGPTLLTAGMGRASSTNGVNFLWVGSDPLIGWNLNPEPVDPTQRDWRHWEAMRLGTDYLFFFSQRDDGGRNRIGLAYTYDDVVTRLPERLISNRLCDGPMDTGGGIPGEETDETDETDTTTDSDSDIDTAETDAVIRPGDRKSCGCDGPGSPAAAVALVLAGLALRRRH